MTTKPFNKNTLFYGDNLEILKEYIASESVDLIYLDPPFNSNRNYNVLFKDESGKDSESQITAFEDTWHWNETAHRTYEALIAQPGRTGTMIEAMRQFIGANQVMAYLVMMTARLIELHRVLKPTGSLYLHCDPTASHYLKVILDSIFGPKSFRNEIVWKRTSAHNDPGRYGANIDIILFYTKGTTWTWNQLYTPHDPEYIARFRNVDPDGRRWQDDNLTAKGLSGGGYEYEYKGFTSLWRCPPETMARLDQEGKLHFTKTGGIRRKRYLDETPGVPLQALWDDIFPINSQAAERLGYPTQKPEKLLERIIQTSSNPGDIVLDPFCGCGTAIAAAEHLQRRWLGIDITHLSIALQKNRLKSQFNRVAPADYQVIGEPEDIGAARQLALDDRYQFQWWALSLVNAAPLGGDTGSKVGKKGSDKGIDGLIAFLDGSPPRRNQVIVQVKSGHVKSGDIRDLKGTLEREKAAIGMFITLEEPTRDMVTEAVLAGNYHSPAWGREYPKLQILSIGDLLHRKSEPKMPPEWDTQKQARRTHVPEAAQLGFDL
jgi:site-specific DNA-methyltransferase (adenine-specific)